jgi:hypothetical protein
MAERPSLGRDDSYNRVTLSRDLKSQIMNMITDSSESLPLPSVSESEENLPSTSNDSHSAPPPITNGSSKLADVPMNSEDIPTPTPDKPNPLDQVPTVRVDSSQDVQEEDTDTEASAVDFATPSPMRSHEPDGPQFGKLGSRISKMVTSDYSQTDLEGDKETLGTTASRATTVSQTPSNLSSSSKKARPGMDKRQSTVKRISNAFKRSVSHKQ